MARWLTSAHIGVLFELLSSQLMLTLAKRRQPTLIRTTFLILVP